MLKWKCLLLYFGHWQREKLKVAGIVIYTRNYEQKNKMAHINGSIN